MVKNPPKLAKYILQWFIKDELAEEVLGDLEEKFYQISKTKTITRAKLNYWYQVFNYLRSFAFKNYRSNSNNYAMLKSYFTIGWRNLLKSKTFSFINISGGLSLGLTCSILIALWVQDEHNMDAFHENSERVYTITSREYKGHEITYGGYDTPGLLGEELKRVLPEVEYASK